MPKDDDSFSNVFDVVAHSGKKPEKQPEAPKKTVEEYRKTSSLPTDTNAAFEQCQKMSQAINQTIEDSFKNTKLSPKKLQEYLSNPNNFTAAQWKALKAKKQELEDKLKAIASRAGIKKETETKEEEKPDEKKKVKKGVHKQRWLPMH
jgi:hypothetical protein